MLEHKRYFNFPRRWICVVLTLTLGLTLITFRTRSENINGTKNLQFQSLKESISLPIPTPSTRKADAVIMVTQTRSGSSFVGEIFNQNPGVGYFYEPLYPFGQCSNQVDGVSDYFRSVISHEFTAIQNLYKKTFLESKVKQINGCVKHSMCFYGCGKCSKFMNRDLRFCENGKCANSFDVERLSKEISQQTFLAFKVTRVCDFEDIKKVITDPDRSVKIVHLVRDPRASINSMTFTIGTPMNKGIINDRCQHFETLVNYKTSHLGLLNDDNYLMVRHEDIALKPILWADKIYKFIGHKMSNVTRDWLLHATSQHNSSQLASKSRFGTTRNSTEVVSNWRNQLDFKFIQEVQNRCFQSMEILGYRKFHSPAEVKDLGIPSFTLNES